MRSIVFVAALAVTVLVPAVALYRVLRVRRGVSTAAEQATYNVLHKANEAAPPVPAGLLPAPRRAATSHRSHKGHGAGPAFPGRAPPGRRRQGDPGPPPAAGLPGGGP